MLELSANSISTFYRCREQYRRVYIQKIQSKQVSLPLRYGVAIHRAAEKYWKGEGYETAFNAAIKECELLDIGRLNPKQWEKWMRMIDELPDLVATYFDQLPKGEVQMVEHEFSHPFQGVVIKGRIDRVMVGPVLRDLKSASEIGENWKSNYRDGLTRNFAFAIYDWYLRQVGLEPKSIEIECLVKGFKSKPPRLEMFNISAEIFAGRRRFDQLLEFKVKEIQHWHDAHLNHSPWTMADNEICLGKYEPCPFLKLCSYGDSPKILSLYEERRKD